MIVCSTGYRKKSEPGVLIGLTIGPGVKNLCQNGFRAARTRRAALYEKPMIEILLTKSIR